MESIYLVMEFDNNRIYLPFKSLIDLDNYTVGFDNMLELVATTKDILGLSIPNEEILDAYISTDIDNIEDDMQEFNDRYLSIKYMRDNYDKKDLEKKFIKYVKSNLNRSFSEFAGLKNIYDNYVIKYLANRTITDTDISKISLLYLGDNYKRYKDVFYKLKDKKVNVKILEKEIKYTKENIDKMYEEDIMLLVNGTNMSIPELNECISRQNKGMTR